MTSSLIIICLFGFLASKTHAIDEQSTVDLQFELTTDGFRVICDVSTKRATFLKCPLSNRANSPCFEDCQPTCDITVMSGNSVCQVPDSLKGVYCYEENRAEGKRITYEFDQSKKVNNSLWCCEHGGKRSPCFTYIVKSTLPIIKPTVAPPDIDIMDENDQDATTTTLKTKRFPTTPRKNQKLDENEGTVDESQYIYKSNEMWSQQISSESVFVIICLLILSLMINVSFCIRCFLVRCFINHQRKNKNNQCLKSCLCVSLCPFETYSLSGSSTVHHGVYDEITHTSPTMNTFSTKNSQLTADSESLSACSRRKVFPNGEAIYVPSASFRYQSMLPRRPTAHLIYDDVPMDNSAFRNLYYAQMSNCSGDCRPMSPQTADSGMKLDLIPVGMDDDDDPATQRQLTKTLITKADQLLQKAGTLLKEQKQKSPSFNVGNAPCEDV